ncbi:MAG: hypothetical protein WC729_10760 [Sphingomonas sp.]|jgi:hypothetical protein|uniref:hypothetical protein n=1 Tax=Sphingomonas sp. TaxID=28214 RepID=UPI003564EBF1
MNDKFFAIGEVGMTSGLIALAILAVLVVLVLRGIRGHVRSGDTSEKPDGIGNPGTDGYDH